MSERMVLGIVLFVLTFAGSLAACAFVLVRLPVDHFARTERASIFPDRPAWQRTALRIGKNALGCLLVVAGILMAIPGIPGQGLLTVLIGVLLIDLPGKKSFERKLFGLASVRGAANRLRARFGRQPFAWDEAAPAGNAAR